jgi:hypothetical protein
MQQDQVTSVASRTKCEIREILVLLQTVDRVKPLDALFWLGLQAARHFEGDSMNDVFGHLDPRLQRIWAGGTSGRIARRWSATDDWLPPQWLDFNAEIETVCRIA